MHRVESIMVVVHTQLEEYVSQEDISQREQDIRKDE